jgi:cell division protein FtsB
MTTKQNILVSLAVFLLICMLFFIVFSERGLADLNLQKKERDRVAGQIRQLTTENIDLGVEIDRLKNDPGYIESVARREFGMIGKNEVVVKSQRTTER